LKYVKVVINLENIAIHEYCLYTIVAHEMIHAVQYDKELFDVYDHDICFAVLANLLKEYLLYKGYPILKNIFNPMLDVS
jgi:hypothetical protein